MSISVSSFWLFVRPKFANRRVAAVSTLALGLAGTVVFGFAVNDMYAVQDWLLWPMLTLWLWVALFAISCISFGQFVLSRLTSHETFTAIESVTLSMAVGVVCFAMVMYAGGALSLFVPSFAVLFPGAMLCVGARDGYTLLRRVVTENASSRSNWVVRTITLFGLFYLALVYLEVLTPDSLSVDSSMVHMKIAQDYARNAKLVPFLANYHASVPHLKSILDTWAFIVPDLQPALRWMLALHIEFFMFAMTLVGVSATIQRTLGDNQLRAGWVAVFLFPGFFAADSNLSGSADHILAFFSIAIVLSALHLCKGFSRGGSVLLGLCLAGAMLTKYQAVYVIGSTALVIVLVWLRGWVSILRSGWHNAFSKPYRVRLWAPAIVIATTAVLVSPHFIKNAVFYHNPVYPFMQDVFKNSRPQFRNAPFFVAHLYEDHNWVPAGTLLDKLWHSAQLFCIFSFKPHYFLKDYAYFGSLFTLLFPGILFINRRREVVKVAWIGAGALLLWGMTFNVDRNLQTFMPVLACATGAIIVRLWNLGWLARVGLIPVVAFQVAWGADLPLFDGRGDRLRSAMDLMSAGIEKRTAKRFESYRRSYIELGEAVPKNSRILMHLGYDSVGIDRDIYLDRPGFQGLISYQDVTSPRGLYDYYQSLGITYFILDGRENQAAAQDETLIRILLRRFSTPMGTFGPYHLFRLPLSAPPAERPYKVLALGISEYTAGLYPIERMNTIEFLGGTFKKFEKPVRDATPTNAESLLLDADVVLFKKGYVVSDPFRSALASHFESVDNWRDDVELYWRRRR